MADDKWPEFLELICGKYVKGGRHEFEVQKRRPRDGGDWTEPTRTLYVKSVSHSNSRKAAMMFSILYVSEYEAPASLLS